MDLNLVIVISVIALNSFLGLTIFMGVRNRVNVVFSTLILFVIFWSLANYLAEVINNEFLVRILVDFTYAAAIIIATLFLRFALLFPREINKLSTLYSILLYSSSFGFILLSFTRLIVQDVYIISPRNSISSGPAITLFITYFMFLMVLAFISIFKKYIKSEGIERTQILYVILGTILSVVGASVTNLFLPLLTGHWDISRYGPHFTIFLITFSSYAILKHHLFNIKVIATELLTFAIWGLLLAQTVLADSLRSQFINGALLLLVVIVGIFLIKSVIGEVEQREKLEVLTKELGAANERLVKLDQLKSQFLSFASHQVKTPITIVKGYASLIADGTYGVVSEKIKEISHKIIEASDRMVSLVNNILDLRKIDEGRMDYKFSDIDLVGLIKAVVAELRSITERRGLDLKADLPEEKWLVKADEEKLRQVIQNLVDNAIKYTEKGWIEVSMKKEGEQVLISVSDSGRGISQELLPRLFEQWTRDSKAAKEIKGTGLGLYIAREIVSAHGGEIWAESRGEGAGSTFYVRLKLSEKMV